MGSVAVIGQLCQPLVFWSQLWKGEEALYSLIEKPLSALYAALLAVEAVRSQELPHDSKDHLPNCKVCLRLDGQAS